MATELSRTQTLGSVNEGVRWGMGGESKLTHLEIPRNTQNSDFKLKCRQTDLKDINSRKSQNEATELEQTG